MAEWFYRCEGTDQGPVSEQDLKLIFESGVLSLNTPVWQEGMQHWVEANTIPALLHSPKEDSLAKAQVLPQLLKTKAETKKFSKLVRLGFTAAICLGLAGVGVWKSKSNRSSTAGFDESRKDQNQIQGLHKPEPTKESGDLNKNIEKYSQNLSQSPSDRSDGNNSLNKLIMIVQNAEQSARNSKGISNEDYLRAAHSIKSEAEGSDTDPSTFPSPPIGNPSKVSELLQYLQEKLQNVNQRNPVTLAYNTRNNLWSIHDQRGGYLLDLSELDPSSAQIVSKPQTTLAGNLTGLIYYSVHISTRNSKKRIIAYDSTFLPRVTTQYDVNIPCGSGPGEHDTQKIGEAMAAVIVAYGGKEELSN